MKIFCAAFMVLAGLGALNAEAQDVPVDYDEIRWQLGVITLDEGKEIQKIAKLVSFYGVASSPGDIQTISESIQQFYTDCETDFLRAVTLTMLVWNGILSTVALEEDDLTAFADMFQNDSEEALKQAYVGNRRQMEWYSMWWVLLNDEPVESLEKRRDNRVLVYRAELKKKLESSLPKDRLDVLIKQLREWDSPVEYDACLLLLPELYEVSDKETRSEKLRLLLDQSIPTVKPPPYDRRHTIFHESCLAAMIVGEAALSSTLQELTQSSNPYIAIKARPAAAWIEAGIKYPFEYEYLKGLYGGLHGMVPKRPMKRQE